MTGYTAKLAKLIQDQVTALPPCPRAPFGPYAEHEATVSALEQFKAAVEPTPGGITSFPDEHVALLVLLGHGRLVAGRVAGGGGAVAWLTLGVCVLHFGFVLCCTSRHPLPQLAKGITSLLNEGIPQRDAPSTTLAATAAEPATAADAGADGVAEGAAASAATTAPASAPAPAPAPSQPTLLAFAAPIEMQQPAAVAAPDAPPVRVDGSVVVRKLALVLQRMRQGTKPARSVVISTDMTHAHVWR